MNCVQFETDIALYAGGDLPPARHAPLESHLAECAACRALAAELRGTVGLLASLRDDPVDEILLARVHQGVLARIPAPRSSRRYWKLAWAALLILAAVFAWPRHSAMVQVLPRPRASRPIAPSLPAAPVIPAVRKSHRARRRIPAAPAGPPLLVQFVTDDPNIVVYWLIDNKPQGD